jgi:hypothetical protein
MTDVMAWAGAGQLLTLYIQPAGSARDGGVRWSFLRLVQVRLGRCVPYQIRACGIKEGHGSIESCLVTCVATDVRAAKSVVAHIAIWVTRSHRFFHAPVSTAARGSLVQACPIQPVSLVADLAGAIHLL